MKNALVTIEANDNYLASLAQQFPELAGLNDEAMAGVSAGFPPSIGLKGTRFVIKEDGAETVLESSRISVVMLRAKPSLDKVWYATKFVPGQEPQSPDCFSRDGVRPDPASTLKQAESCAGCPRNVFGTATDASGNPTKGKACTDSKIVAVFCNDRVYQIKIPPASLKNFASHVKTLNLRNIPLPACVTSIGFDPKESYPVLTFNYDGMIAPEVVGNMLQLIKSDEVNEIVGKVMKALPAAPAAPIAEIPKVEAPKVVAPPVIEAPKVVAPIVEAPKAANPSDDDLARALGL